MVEKRNKVALFERLFKPKTVLIFEAQAKISFFTKGFLVYPLIERAAKSFLKLHEYGKKRKVII